MTNNLQTKLQNAAILAKVNRELCDNKIQAEYKKECQRADELEDSYWKSEKENAKLKKQLEIVKKYLPLIKRNVSVGSLAYTYVTNAQTEIKELEK